MEVLRYTLLGEGSSDRALLPVLNWLLRHLRGEIALEPQWVDRFGMDTREPGLAHRVFAALDHYPCDLLFIHRDADNAAPAHRRAETLGAFEVVKPQFDRVRCVCVVPVRMTETWLLTSEAAIRRAAGNPLGTAALELPRLSRLEDEPAPKEVLRSAIRAASELGGRRLKKLNIPRAIHAVAEFTEDFSPLLRLPAFRQLEQELSIALAGILPQPPRAGA